MEGADSITISDFSHSTRSPPPALKLSLPTVPPCDTSLRRCHVDRPRFTCLHQHVSYAQRKRPLCGEPGCVRGACAQTLHKTAFAYFSLIRTSTTSIIHTIYRLSSGSFDWTRTSDLRIIGSLLYQLSYETIGCSGWTRTNGQRIMSPLLYR
jgi:hypothetical protein